MHSDTVPVVQTIQVEQGMRTLAHDWRNVLNGINLRINSADFARSEAERLGDLAEVQLLITGATRELGNLSRKLAPLHPSIIPYPAQALLEDLQHSLVKKDLAGLSRLKWIMEELTVQVLVDFASLSEALYELIDNTLRYFQGTDIIVVEAMANGEFFTLSWKVPCSAPLKTDDWGKTPFFTTTRGRLGLGLYYSRRVLEAHDGKLSFVYSVPGQTLQTTLQLPLETS